MATGGERESARVRGLIAETNLRELIDSFRNSNEKVELLNSLQLAFLKCPRRKLQDDLANVDLQTFFATFPILNEEEMGLCCEVIDSLFVAFEHEVVIEKYSHELRQGLNVDHPSIQLVCLAELKRIPIDLYERFLFKEESAISSLIHLIACEPLQGYSMLLATILIIKSVANLRFTWEEMGLCCEVIDSLFVAFEHEVVIEKYSHELRQGLNVDHPSIQLVCLAELKRIPIDLYERFLFKEESAISSLIHLIACEPLQVGLSAVSALSRIGKCNYGTFRLIDNHFQELETTMAKSDAIRSRFYEMIMNVAAADPRNLPMIVESGLMHKLVNELFDDNKPDILAQRNCLEILTTFAQTDFGFRWCLDAGILAKIENLLGTIGADSILATLLPGLIKFFGCLAKVKPGIICNKHKVFMSSLFSATESKDMTLKGIAMETIAEIGATADGKKILQTYDKLDRFIITIGKTLERSSDLRVSSLTAIHHLIMLKPADHSQELLTLTKHWFQLLGQDAFKSIFKFCQHPFENICLDAQTVLLSLAYQPWGQQLMCNYPTFKEYLLDRTMESEQEWKHGKFKIIEALLECSFTEEYFGAEFYQKLVAHRDA